jgi:filamentous hemagglutinin
VKSTDAVVISGSRAIDKGQSYEKGVREIYGDVPFSDRQYEVLVDGKWVSGVADNVVTIGGKNTAIEAKFVDDWATSIRNPASQNGIKPWALAEQQKMLDQAKNYSKGFADVVYHTNSEDLVRHYSKVFTDAGIENFKFVITPTK